MVKKGDEDLGTEEVLKLQERGGLSQLHRLKKERLSRNKGLGEVRHIQ